MALIELKSNLANYRSEFTTPSVASQTVNNLQQPSRPNINKPSNSNLDIDSIPPSYKITTQFNNSFINSSLFDRANEFISKYTGVTRFTQNTVNTSKYNIDTASSKFSLQGIYTPSKFNINTIVNTSIYNIDSTPNKFSPTAIYTPSKFDNNTVVNTSKYNIDGNLSKFSLQGIYTPSNFNSNTVINTSKYNIDTTPSKFSPQGIYDPSKFNINTVVNTSKYNIDTTPSKFSPQGKYEPSKFNPEAIIPDTITRWKGTTAPAVNFFIDRKSGASGFTTKFTDPNQTKFIGTTATSYKYPKLLGLSDRLVSRPVTNSKFPNTGTATLADQLPGGSVFHYAKEGVIVSKKFSTKGYSESRKYGDNVKSIKEQSSKSLLFTRATEENSPSAIDQQYKKFNLRDDAFNTGWNRQPFVLRGIQRKGKERPQYWGFGSSKPGFDDGLIQGGAVTVADRVKADLDRIGSWMTSPKGLLWIVKQVGLGFSNPKVETAGLLVPRLTRIHTGVASLLSVAGSPFGLHFDRHGIPFVNSIAKYENVQKIKKLKFDASPGRSNRLIDLRNDLRLNIDKRRFFSRIDEGMQIPTLSGLGGPNSLYGIGYTDISRGSKSIKSGFDDRQERVKINPFTISNNYQGFKAGYKTAVNNTVKLLQSFGLDRGESETIPSDLKSIANQLIGNVNISGFSTKAKDYSANPFNNGIDSNITRAVKYGDGVPLTPINSYITYAYSQIPKDADKSIIIPNDFRSKIVEEGSYAGSATEFSILGGALEGYYAKRDLEGKYGFGRLGEVGAIRASPWKFAATGSEFGKGDRAIILQDTSFRGDRVTALDVDLKKGIASNQVYADGERDLIKFYFQDGAVQNGKEGNFAVMTFRATMTGFTDSFSPGWDRIDIMGRPDGAYLYNSFERNISFNFTVAALSRSEMIPMWRKLNYLASYTMPDFNGNARPSGPFMRITIGDLFQQTPGFITSLSYTIPDDATWDIADDYPNSNLDAKQLPMVVEASVSFTIVGDYRPQMHGRVYSLSPRGTRADVAGQWLRDAQF